MSPSEANSVKLLPPKPAPGSTLSAPPTFWRYDSTHNVMAPVATIHCLNAEAMSVREFAAASSAFASAMAAGSEAACPAAQEH